LCVYTNERIQVETLRATPQPVATR
jgi:hypothetical protein